MRGVRRQVNHDVTGVHIWDNIATCRSHKWMGIRFPSLLYGVTDVVFPKEFKLFSFPIFCLAKVTTETARAH